MRKFNSQKGQTILIVMLVMVVVLTVGLALASRSVTNVKISKQNEESQRAFQAAEAGIELFKKSIKEGAVSYDAASPNLVVYQSELKTNNSAVQVNTEAVTFQGQLLNNGNEVPQDVGVDIWLAPYEKFISSSFDPNNPSHTWQGRVNIYWKTAATSNCSSGAGNATQAAIEVITLTDSKTNPILVKRFLDACGARRGVNGATNAGITVVSGLPATNPLSAFNGGNRASGSPASLTKAIVMRVIPLYNSALIGVEFDNDAGYLDAPVQGTIITSTGQSGETVRKLKYYDPYPQIPNELFQYAIMSQGYEVPIP